MMRRTILPISLSLTTAFFISLSSANAAGVSYDKKNVDGSVKYERKNGNYTLYKINPQADKLKYEVGRKATKNEIKAWDVDVMPDGTGLPKGSGNIDDGEELYEQQCAMCHGDFGSGGKGYPPLSGGEHGSLKNQLLAPGDEPPSKVIGSYWPYASTLFWYIKTGMPFPHPMSLSDDEVYAITAYLLNVNEVTFKNGDDIEELNQDNFKNIDMPNKDGFYPDVDGANAKENMKQLLAHPEKYGKGTRCMHDCIKGKVPVMHIKVSLNDGIEPKLTTERNWKEQEVKVAGKGEQVYNDTCAACHATDAIGAPMFGDKDSWSKVMSQGIDTVYKHAINGFNAMPPKGGNMGLSDEDVKAAVDYMIEHSK